MIQLELEEALAQGDTQPLFKAISQLKTLLTHLKSSAPTILASKTAWDEHQQVIHAFDAARAVLTRVLLEHEINKDSTI